MTVEQLLDWAATILGEADSALTTKTLADRLSHQFHATLDKLEVLLSLDKRFVRDSDGQWQLNPTCDEESTAKLVSEAVGLREKAIEVLIAEREVIEGEITTIRERLAEVDRQLSQPGPGPIPGPEPGEDNRYMSCWPLPGGKRQFVSCLTAILEQIADRGPSLNDLTAWAKQEFECGDWMKGAIRVCVLNTQLVHNRKGLLELAQAGQHFLQTGDTKIVGQAFVKHIWGVKEMLLWLENRSMTKEELYEAYSNHGASWRNMDQVIHRLNWLTALGWVWEDKRGRPCRYVLSEAVRGESPAGG